jgi:DNA (cytosine-5)-methyltransferase 1
MSRVQGRRRRARPGEFGPFIDGLIASPPCQAWSMAGKGGGRRDVEHVIACALELAAGNDTRAEHAAKCEDERSMLVVEPLRWALALEAEWIALEQVPPVLELWTLFAQILEQHGWNTWAGVLEAERYGVPQTRRSCIRRARRISGASRRDSWPWVSMAEALGWDDGRAYRLARGVHPPVPTNRHARRRPSVVRCRAA